MINFWLSGKKGLMKKRYDVNVTKLKEIVTNLNGNDHFLILRAKNIGAWMNVRGTTVTVTVLAAKKFRGFCAQVMMLPPLTSRANEKAVAHSLMYVTYLSAAKEASSSNITRK